MTASSALDPSVSIYARSCVQRLRENPLDPDALFTSAALHAASGRTREALRILDDLTKVAPRYPGLWRFKARLFESVGDGRMAKLCLATAEREDARLLETRPPRATPVLKRKPSGSSTSGRRR